MTEREKMVRGLLYWPGDGELAEARDRCKTLCQQFNQLVYRDMDAACAALNEALPHAGQGFWMEPPPSGATTAGTSPPAKTST